MSENNQPVFSIITPTCRRPALLKRNIRSVINQTYNNYEHIIVDDADDMETETLVKGFADKRIIFHQHKKPKGAAGGYNSGIKISRGKFILFLDDDDEYLPAFLEKMYNHFAQSGLNIGFVWTGISRIKDTNTGEELIYSKIWPSRFPTKESGLVEATSIGNGFGVCVRKECIDTIGLYDESLMIGEDTDFLFRLARNFDFETIPEVLVKIHQHSSTQLTGDKYFQNQVEGKEKILARYRDFIVQYPTLYYIHHKAYADYCYKWKLKRKGRNTMISILKNTPFRILTITDLLFYELTGKDTLSFYQGRKIKLFVDFLRKRKQTIKS